MKSNKCQRALIFIFLFPIFITTENVAGQIVFPESFEHKGYWPQNNVTFILGRRSPNLLGQDESDTLQLRLLQGRMASVAAIWLDVSYMQFQVSNGCNHGDAGIDNCTRQSGVARDDGKNAIMFNAVPPGGFRNALGVADRVVDRLVGCLNPRPGSRLCLQEKYREMDVYIRPERDGWATTKDPGSCQGGRAYVENTLAHEIGHALGAPDSRAVSDIMYHKGL